VEVLNKRIIQNIFRSYFSAMDYKKLPLKDIKAAEAIMLCRTPEQGYNYLACPDGHEGKVQLHSCKHRSCPICADKARHTWIESQKNRLLHCAHYHVIFTLPHEYIKLWQYNREWFTKAIFKACRDTLMELLRDKKYLGATPGLLMTLHTWGRQLNYHPHVHCLVTAGGITQSGDWKSLEGEYLLPVRVVKALYRGKLQAVIKAAIKQDELRLPAGCSEAEATRNVNQLYKKQWSVRIQERYEHGKGVMLYLARYMKGGPIKPEQIIRCTNKIEFLYKDHRDQKVKLMALRRDEFMRRILWHVPAVGVHVVRHYGLYASRSQEKRDRCREEIGGPAEAETKAGKVQESGLDWCCDQCGALLRRTFSVYRPGRYENSCNNECALRTCVQQGAQTDLANVPQNGQSCINAPPQLFFGGVRDRLA
jgi:hypothetical protein